jgi:hypothetical protein
MKRRLFCFLAIALVPAAFLSGCDSAQDAVGSVSKLQGKRQARNAAAIAIGDNKKDSVP